MVRLQVSCQIYVILLITSHGVNNCLTRRPHFLNTVPNSLPIFWRAHFFYSLHRLTLSNFLFLFVLNFDGFRSYDFGLRSFYLLCSCSFLFLSCWTYCFLSFSCWTYNPGTASELSSLNPFQLV